MVSFGHEDNNKGLDRKCKVRGGEEEGMFQRKGR